MDNYTLDEHINKCRCCFKQLANGVRHLKISPQHENNFYLLTQLELRSSIEFSNQICTFCDMELERYSKFRFDAMDRQQKLYDLYSSSVGDVKHQKNEFTDFLAVAIKEEPAEFDLRECSVIVERTDVEQELKIEFENITNINHQFRRSARQQQQLPLRELKMKEQEKVKKKKIAKLNQGNINKPKPIYHGRKPEFNCDICGYFTTKRGNFTMHMRRTHLPKQFRCDVCDYRCRYLLTLNEHKNRHLETLPPELHCPHCEKPCISRASLRNHIRIVHENIKPKVSRFNCTMCDKSYHTKQYLQDHYLSTHTNQEPEVLCEFCPKRFFSAHKLLEHKSFYHSKKKIKCKFDGCEKTFTSNSKMERHHRVHKDEKIYKCEKCPMEYRTPQYRNFHYEVHHLGYRYWCVYPECGAEYKHKLDIKNHLRKHHTQHPEELKKYRILLKEQKPHIVDVNT